MIGLRRNTDLTKQEIYLLFVCTETTGDQTGDQLYSDTWVVFSSDRSCA